MIPFGHITAWRLNAPWPDTMQVEQDLILSRILVEIFTDPLLNRELAFRGGTALHKLFIQPPARYSEDIDLVRTSNGPISNIADCLRSHIDPWLGKPKIKQNDMSFKFLYRFSPEGAAPETKFRIKIEINIQETFAISERFNKKFSVQSDWFSGEARVNTFQLEEILATKLRALYQRTKGRDLFDLWHTITQINVDIPKVIEIFHLYMQKNNHFISRALFEKNLEMKLTNQLFLEDIGILLSPNLKKSHASNLITEDQNIILTEKGNRLLTEGWSLFDAAAKIKDTVLCHLS